MTLNFLLLYNNGIFTATHSIYCNCFLCFAVIWLVQALGCALVGRPTDPEKGNSAVWICCFTAMANSISILAYRMRVQ